MGSNINNDSFFNRWALVTGIIQLLDYDLNVAQISNDEIFKKLQNQDKILEQQSQELQKQTNEYLFEIIEQNKKILELLTETKK